MYLLRHACIQGLYTGLGDDCHRLELLGQASCNRIINRRIFLSIHGLRLLCLRSMDIHGQFDQSYYDQYYLSAETRVISEEEHAHLARFVFEFAQYNGIAVHTVLDVGAGIGLWKRWIEKNSKKSNYLGTEVSKVMCKEHGFVNKDIARWRDRKEYDLVICQGVLQYLPDPDVAPAVANLAAMCGGLLYAEITTRVDLRERTDKDRTDSKIHVRNGSYYRGLLQKHFVQVGGGLWWKKELPIPFYELEMNSLAK